MFTQIREFDNNSKKTFFKEVRQFCQEQNLNQLTFFGDTEFFNISLAETYRALIDYDFSNRHMRDVFLSHLESISNYCPAAIPFIPFFLAEKEIILEHEDCLKITKQSNEKEILDIIEYFFSHSSMMSPEDFQNIFLQNGFISNFSVKFSNSEKNACVYSDGYRVNGEASDLFQSILQNNLDFLDCHIIIYDGYIQEVSELNLILNKSYEEKEKFLIICSGCSKDVQNTCFVNFSQKKAFVMPFTPGLDFWKEDSKYLISNLELQLYGLSTGTLLNNYDFSKSKKISVTVSKKFFLVKEKLKLNKSAETSIFISEKHRDRKGVLWDQINLFSSLLQQIATCGTFSVDDFEKISNFNLRKMMRIEIEHLPSMPVFRALNEANKIRNKILNTGCMIQYE